MVFTRSMKQTIYGAMSLIFSPELDRIQKDYASADEESRVPVKAKKTKARVKAEAVQVKAEQVKAVQVNGTNVIIGSAFDYIKWLKGPPSPCPSPCPSIDFDDAHNEWTANKKRKMNGDYVYICGAPLKNGKKCNRDCCDKIGLYSGCRQHYSWEESEQKVSQPSGNGLRTF